MGALIIYTKLKETCELNGLLVTSAYLAGATGYSTRRVTQVLAYMEAMGFVARPNGQRSGWTIPVRRTVANGSANGSQMAMAA